MILAGDIGGTKTILALFDWTTERVEPVRQQTFYSADYKAFEDILDEFLNPPPPPPLPEDEGPGKETTDEGESSADSSEGPKAEEPPVPEKVVIDAACFGIAGPVIDNRVRTTNLPWVIDGAELATRFEIPTVKLLNDLEAMAYSILVLRPEEYDVLNAGSPPKEPRAIALIAAGTGLGEAMLCWDGQRYTPMASEGGHTDFAPNSDEEINLLRYLRTQYLHVSYERVVSGAGLVHIYEYLRDAKKNEPTWLAEKMKAGDPAAAIAEAGLSGQTEIAKQALNLFATIYGAEAGNLALKTLSLNGVYLGGGIAPKLLGKLKEGLFMRAFINKGRYKKLMSQIPVRVILNPHAGLLGAASMAANLACPPTPATPS
jgi:glucokinase